MLRIAIVEDELDASDILKEMLEKYAHERKQEFKIFSFKNAIIFLNNYQANYDLIFMDIQMPYMDGMTASAKLREVDSETMLIFVTNMAKMAVNGYEVSAFDFVVKPVHYESLALKLERVMTNLSRRQAKKIIILSEGKRVLIPASSIFYVEIFDHQLVYHTEYGDYPAYGTMTKMREKLEDIGFFQCNKCYLVNLRYVRKVVKHTITVNDVELQVSHPKRKAFMEALNNYIGG